MCTHIADIDTITKGIGTPRCMAPELYTPKGEGYIYDEKIDIFAVGCTYFMMLTGYEPVSVSRDTRPLAWPERFGLERARCHKFVDSTGELTPDGVLLSSMTQADPFNRPSARELFDWCNTWM
jgi:serine/threonine protein kinase